MDISDSSNKQEQIKQILRALNTQVDILISEYQDEKNYNEARVFEISETLRDFNSSAGETFPSLQHLGSQQNQAQLGELKATKTNDKNHQTDVQTFSKKFDKSAQLARILCQLWQHLKLDSENLSKIDTVNEFPISLNLEKGKYFIGFCTYTEEKGATVAKPKYGLLFEPNQYMKESLYIGKVSFDGIADSNLGVYFKNLDFSDECLIQSLPHSIQNNTLNKYKSFYKGGFALGKFEGEGEYVNLQPEENYIHLPFLTPHNQQDRFWSKLWVKAGSNWVEGEIDGQCELEFTNDSYKSKPYPIVSFKGIIEDGVFHREGVLTFSNGDVYEGNFVQGKRSGAGVYKSEKYTFEGEWKDDLMNGTFKVEFKDDVRGTVEGIVFEAGVPNTTDLDQHINDLIQPSFLLKEGSKEYDHEVAVILEKNKQRESKITIKYPFRDTSSPLSLKKIIKSGVVNSRKIPINEKREFNSLFCSIKYHTSEYILNLIPPNLR